jgi:SAM-dependent methyltransferase
MSTVFTWRPEDIQALLESCEHDDITPLIHTHFPRENSVLEAGCGLGRYVRYLKDHGYRAFGIEHSNETLKAVHGAWPDLALVAGDAAVAPFADASFDALLSLGLIEHWTEGPSVPLREHLRILKPGGIAIISVPLHSTVRRWKRNLWLNEVFGLPYAIGRRLFRGASLYPNRLKAAPHAIHPTFGPFFEYRLTPDEFVSVVRQAGFEITAHEPLGRMDGFYHELNPFGMLVRFRDWRFTPTALARALNQMFSRRPFFHSHMQVVVARRPQ